MKWSTKAIIKCNRRDDTYQVFGSGEDLALREAGSLMELIETIEERLEESYRQIFGELMFAWRSGKHTESGLKIQYKDCNGNLCWFGLQFMEAEDGFFIVWEEISRHIGFEKKNRNTENRLKEQERLLRQVNAHLLFNTMNIIKGYIQFDTDMAGQVINLLAKSMRLGMEMLREEGPILFVKELEYISLKMKIEQTCYENLQFETDCKVKDFYVPPFSIQRLVEALMGIGFLELEKDQKIVIKTDENEENIEIGIAFENTILQERTLEDRQAIARMEELMEGWVSEISKTGQNISLKIILPKKNALEGVYII